MESWWGQRTGTSSLAPRVVGTIQSAGGVACGPQLSPGRSEVCVGNAAVRNAASQKWVPTPKISAHLLVSLAALRAIRQRDIAIKPSFEQNGAMLIVEVSHSLVRVDHRCKRNFCQRRCGPLRIRTTTASFIFLPPHCTSAKFVSIYWSVAILTLSHANLPG